MSMSLVERSGLCKNGSNLVVIAYPKLIVINGNATSVREERLGVESGAE